MEAFWSEIFKQFKVEKGEDNIVITEPAGSTKLDKEKITEYKMENFNFPYMYLVQTPILALYSEGIDSGLVISSGDSVTSVTPVFEGSALTINSLSCEVAGSRITETL